LGDAAGKILDKLGKRGTKGKVFCTPGGRRSQNIKGESKQAQTGRGTEGGAWPGGKSTRTRKKDNEKFFYKRADRKDTLGGWLTQFAALGSKER